MDKVFEKNSNFHVKTMKHYRNFLFTTLFKRKSLWLIYDLVKTLEINASTLFKLAFASNDILPCLFFFFLITDLYPEVIGQICDPIIEIAIPIVIPSKEAKAEIEINPQLWTNNLRQDLLFMWNIALWDNILKHLIYSFLHVLKIWLIWHLDFL